MQGIDNLPKSGGSTILNESGIAVTARDNLQFADGLKVTDDSGNNKTKVGVNTTFTEASTRANIASGDTFSTILGKIKKFFTDLKAVAFSGSYNDLSNKPTIPTNTSDLNNDSGYVTVMDLSYKVDKSGDTMSGDLSIEHQGSESVLSLGTNQPALTPQASSGRIDLWTAPLNTAYKTSLSAGGNTANRSINFPDKSGTVALTSDISTNADTVDGSHAWEFQTLSESGSPHGSSSWIMKCQHNVDGDGYFKIYCGNKSIGTKVDRANYAVSANIYNSLKHVETQMNFSGGYYDYNFGKNVLIISCNGYGNYGVDYCWSRVSGYSTWRIVAQSQSGTITSTQNIDIWYVEI